MHCLLDAGRGTYSFIVHVHVRSLIRLSRSPLFRHKRKGYLWIWSKDGELGPELCAMTVEWLSFLADCKRIESVLRLELHMCPLHNMLLDLCLCL